MSGRVLTIFQNNHARVVHLNYQSSYLMISMIFILVSSQELNQDSKFPQPYLRGKVTTTDTSSMIRP